MAWRDPAGPSERSFHIPPHLVDVVVLVLVLELAMDGPALQRWLERRGLVFVGEMEGDVESFGITDDGMVQFSGRGGDILLHASVERFILQLVREVYRRQGYRSIVEFREWLADIGLDVIRLAES